MAKQPGSNGGKKTVFKNTRVRVEGSNKRDCLSNDDDNDNVKKTIGFMSKTTALHVYRAFYYIFLCFFEPR